MQRLSEEKADWFTLAMFLSERFRDNSSKYDQYFDYCYKKNCRSNQRLEKVGADLIRVSVPDGAKPLKKLKSRQKFH